MLHWPKRVAGPCLLALGCLLFYQGNVRAEEKKQKEPTASEPLLSKAEELTEDDEKDTHANLTGSPRKVYPVKLTEGKTYQIDLKSKDFDAVLRLEDPKGKEVALNDDFNPPGLDSRIIYTAPKAGEYKVIATCLDGKPGKFTLTVKLAPAGATASLFKGKTIPLTLKDDYVRHEGKLTDDDPAVRKHYYKVLTVPLTAGKIYKFDLRSDDIDSFLFLESPDGNAIANDDDGGGGRDARIVTRIPTTGKYRIIATSFPAEETGKFTLEISPPSEKEVQEVVLIERVDNFTSTPVEERKKLIRDVTKRFKDKGEDLELKDALLATRLGMAVEGSNIELARELYQDLAKAFAQSDDQQVGGVVKSFEKIGKEMEISGTLTTGKDFDLKDLKGKVVLVDFWGTWCGPCVAEMPNIVRAYQKYHKKGFEVIGVAKDKSDKIVTRFMEAKKLPWQCINVEDSQKLITAHGVRSYPSTFLIGRDGVIISMRARGAHLDRLLEQLLKDEK